MTSPIRKLVYVIWIASKAGRGAYWAAKSRLFYAHLFGTFGPHSKLIRPLHIHAPQHIHLGAHVLIHDYSWIAAYPQQGTPPPSLTIESGTTIGHFSHITCANCVYIDRDVLIADRVHISDNEHAYTDPERPIRKQPVASRGPVKIGAGSWIGENVNILSSSVGCHCVIGANSVVITDIPDHAVAVGVPARVVRQYNPASKSWNRTPHR